MPRLVIVFAIAFALAAISASGEAWWTPDTGRYPYVRLDSTSDTHIVSIHGAAVQDRDRMADIVALFPPYMFDTAREYIPGGVSAGNELFGYIVLVDGGNVTFVVTENRARELAISRILSYLLVCDLVRLWSNYGGYDTVQVSLAYVPAFREPTVFAIGTTTEIGVKVVMAP